METKFFSSTRLSLKKNCELKYKSWGYAKELQANAKTKTFIVIDLDEALE